MRVARLALILMTLVGMREVAHAQADFPGVRAMGMGESMRATATGAEGPLLNPAGMSLVKQYVVEAFYGFRVEDLGHHVHVSIVDSVTSRLGAGLFYSFIYSQPKFGIDWAGGRIERAVATRTGHAAGLSLSLPLGQYFILGTTIKYLHLDSTVPLPNNAVPPNLVLDTVNGVTFDVGMVLKLGDKFNIGVVGYNLWDHGSRESPLSLGFAAAVIPIRSLTISFDGVANFTGYQNYRIDPVSAKVSLDSRVTGRLGPGIEWVAGNRVPIRAGVVYDSGLPATFVTLGLGYVSTSFGVDLGYRVKVQGGIENFIALGLRIFID